MNGQILSLHRQVLSHVSLKEQRFNRHALDEDMRSHDIYMYHNVQFYVTHNGDKIENKFTLFHKDLSTEAKGLILYVADRAG